LIDREQRGHVTVMRERRRDCGADRLSAPAAETQAAQRNARACGNGLWWWLGRVTVF
jgi:hypothetical protein